jgi:hypothetical protein
LSTNERVRWRSFCKPYPLPRHPASTGNNTYQLAMPSTLMHQGTASKPATRDRNHTSNKQPTSVSQAKPKNSQAKIQHLPAPETTDQSLSNINTDDTSSHNQPRAPIINNERQLPTCNNTYDNSSSILPSNESQPLTRTDSNRYRTVQQPSTPSSNYQSNQSA